MGSIMIEINEESVQHLGAEDFKRLHEIVAAEAYRRLKQKAKVNDAHTDKHAQPAGPTATAKPKQ